MQQTTLPTLEGLTPTILWYTLIGLAGIAGLIILADKVGEVFRKRKERREEERARGDGTIQGQLDNINSKLDSLDDFIRETNSRFDRDNLRLNALEAQSKDVKKGIKAIARANLAHLQHDITGNHVDALREAESIITDYLTE